MHQRQCERGIGSGQDLDVLVAFFGSFRFARIDADEFGAIALGLLRVAPEMQVAGDAVAAPDQDQLALGEKLHAHAQLAAIGVQQRFAARARADGAIQQAGAQLVEKAPVHAFGLHKAHGACVAVRKNSLRVARGNRMQSGRNV